jgi:virginiamycin B lyase
MKARSVFAAGLFGLAVLATALTAQTITEFPIPSGNSPFDLTLGPDGNLWFTEAQGNRVGRVTPQGVITEFTIPTAGSFPGGITAGPDGNLWFCANGSNRIVRVTPGGFFTEFPIPNPFPSGGPSSITAGPDGALWFSETDGAVGGRIRRVTTSGQFTLFPGQVPSQSPHQIVAGPDGNLWYSMPISGKVGRVTTAGVITEFPLASPTSNALALAAGPDGAVWIAEGLAAGNRLGRIAPDGSMTELPMPSIHGAMFGLATGPDGALWFTETDAGRIGRATTAGAVTDFAIPTAASSPFAIKAGPDGAVWFAESGGRKIGRISGVAALTSMTVPVAASIHGASGTFFHSDVRVFNRFETSPIIVTARYHCFAPPCGNSTQTFTLSPREMRVFNDMIAVTFNAAESGGAIEFSSTGSLVVTSRLYTPSRPSPTNGMGVPGVLETQALPAAVVTSLSHSADPTKGFRSNVGAYNANDAAQTITFTVFDGNGIELGLTTAFAPARTPVQVSNIFNVIGLASDVAHAYCVVKGDQNLPLLAYAGVIDNQSQDLAFVQGQASSPPTAGRVTIPVSASIHGAGGSFFHTDATVLNTAASASANVTIRYRCFSGVCGNDTQTVTVAPREMRAFDDLIANLFSAPESGGAIQFDTDQPIVVNSRLYTPSRPAPTNGMGVPGLAEPGATLTAVLTSLSHSADPSAGFRSNVGAYNANDVAQTITFTLYDPAGIELGLVTASAPPRTSVQVSNVFAAAGFTRDVPDAYCVVHGDQNLPLIAYAGVIDNQSQDLAFIKGESASAP